jgi:hypothetical protein
MISSAYLQRAHPKLPAPATADSQASQDLRQDSHYPRSGGGRDQLSYPVTQQVGRSTQRDQHTGPVRNVPVLIMTTPNMT